MTVQQCLDTVYTTTYALWGGAVLTILVFIGLAVRNHRMHRADIALAVAVARRYFATEKEVDELLKRPLASPPPAEDPKKS